MAQQNSTDNHRGLVDAGNDLYNGIGKIKTAAKIGRLVTAFNPWVFIISGIVLVFVVFATVLTGGGTGVALSPGGNGAPVSTNPVPGFTINMSVDKTQATPADTISYTITYSYAPPSGSSLMLGDITVYDVLPSSVSFQNASGTKAYDAASNTVSWKLSDSSNAGPFFVTVTINSDNVRIVNSAYATSSSSGSPPSSSGANASTCNGFYTINNPIGNFGDPNCTLASIPDTFQRNDMIKQQLQSNDPKNADFWFNVLIPCESSFSPNSFNGNSTSGTGAYGLFQVNKKGSSTSGQYDVGDVEWPTQIFNATNLAKGQGGSLNYWFNGGCTGGVTSLQY